MTTMTPDERLGQIGKAREEYDRARLRLMTQIGKALDEAEGLPEAERRKLGPSAIGRASRFTREYISQIRDNRKQ